MKRCPKCNRSFPDDNQKFCTIDGGLLVVAEKAFDPNATIQGTTVDLTPAQPKPPSAPLPDFGATIATPSQAPTVVLPKQTGPTGTPTSANLHQQAQQRTAQESVTTALPQVPQPAPQPAPPPAAGAAAPQKKSKLPLILGILALLLVLGAGGAVAGFFLVIKPRLDQKAQPVVIKEPTPENTTTENTNPPANANTSETKPAEPEYVPPPGTTKFENVAADLDSKLAEHYVDFSFYYPSGWVADPKAGKSGSSLFSKFAKTEEDEKGTYLVESASVSWYNSNGTFEADRDIFADRVKSLEDQLAPNYPGYERVSEGETKVNSLPAYEFRFKGQFKNTGKGDLPYWGRVIFVPAKNGEKTGAVISLLATSLSEGLASASDLGDKDETAIILQSFRFATSK